MLRVQTCSPFLCFLLLSELQLEASVLVQRSLFQPSVASFPPPDLLTAGPLAEEPLVDRTRSVPDLIQALA